MSWPTSPISGQTTTINGVVYVYNATKNAWAPSTVAGVSTINYTGNVTAGNLNVTGNLTVNNVSVPTLPTVIALNLAIG